MSHAEDGEAPRASSTEEPLEHLEAVTSLKKIFFLLEDNCFTMLCWFLLYSNVRSAISMQTIARKWKQPRCPSADEWIKKLWYIYTMEDSLEKTLMLGKIEARRRRGWQRVRCLDGITDSMDGVWASSGRWWRTRKPGVLPSRGCQRVRHNLATEQ